MTLNTGGTFLEFISNIIIIDDAIHAHKDTKKRKVVAAPSSSAPPKYRMVYHHGPTYPPRPSTSISVHISSGLPTHLRASASGQPLRLYLHLHL
jgi:hypothetical protein